MGGTLPRFKNSAIVSGKNERSSGVGCSAYDVLFTWWKKPRFELVESNGR
jgi:hypothetical protein